MHKYWEESTLGSALLQQGLGIDEHVRDKQWLQLQRRLVTLQMHSLFLFCSFRVLIIICIVYCRFYQVRVGLKSFSSRPPMKVTCHPPKNPGNSLR